MIGSKTVIRERAGMIVGLRAAMFGVVALLTAATGSLGHAETLSTDDLALYRRAFDAAHNNDWAGAEALAAKGGNATLNRAIGWHRLSDPESGAPLSDYLAFAQSAPDWYGFKTLRRRAESAMTEDTSAEQIEQWFQLHEPLTTEGRVERIRALEQSGNADIAATLARETWHHYDFTADQEKDFLRRFGRLLVPGDNEMRLDNLIWKGWYSSAQRLLPSVNADSLVLGNARLLLARRRRGVDEAIQRVPSRLKDDAGLVFERIRWNRRMGRHEAAYALLKDIAGSPGNSRKWWTERNLQARRLLREGRPDDAYRIAVMHGEIDGFAFAEGEWLAGWIALRHLRDSERALGHFNRLHAGVSYPISRARGAYWAGRAIEAQGKHDEARRWYAEAARHVGTYYGQLAAAKLTPAERPNYARPPPADPQSEAAFQARDLIRAAKLLHTLGESELAGDVLIHLEQNAGDANDSHLVGRLAMSLGRSDIAVRAGRRTYANGAPLHPLGYPRISIADVAMIEGPFAHAVIRQESGFIPRAVSHAGARGLMQLMPKTAEITARKSGMPYSRGRLLDDPNYNTALGQHHLRELLDLYSGSYVLVLAAYNAGKGRANDWIQTYGDPRHPSVDAVDWVESIPFTETRNYVQRVLENLQVYRWLMDGTQLAVRPHDAIYDLRELTAN
ncbi:MAG: lytic transglycosylase domain-containing protein [Alphaproteobacteria bacterium]|nr:lytic transglycosylase domain-containing protein [Alphaproteobacteria bacterium]